MVTPTTRSSPAWYVEPKDDWKNSPPATMPEET